MKHFFLVTSKLIHGIKYILEIHSYTYRRKYNVCKFKCMMYVNMEYGTH